MGDSLPPSITRRRGERDLIPGMERLLRRNFPRFQLLKASHHSDREHSLSGKYLRMQFLSGRHKYAALAALEENVESCAGLLSQAIIWRHWLNQLKSAPPERFYLLVPAGLELVLQSRLHWVKGAGKQLLLARIHQPSGSLELLDLADSGNLDTQLTRVNRHFPVSDWKDNEWVQRILRIAPRAIEVYSSPIDNHLSFRINGLEFASLHQTPHWVLKYGVPCQQELSSLRDWEDLTFLAAHILEERQARPASSGLPFFRLLGERWLESLALRAIQQIDPELDPACVYPQVPMFLGGDRGVIDILGMTLNGQVAVLELKVHENIELPFQGLDYWLRVRWHLERNEFRRNGYFLERELAAKPPRLYFICPQFDYHNTFPLLANHISTAVPMRQIGLNEDWRSGIQVVMRQIIHP
jgi:hypothetical protein